MQRLNATTWRVAASLDLDHVLAEIVRDAVELLGADSGDMLLLDQERNVLRVVAVASFPPEMVGFEMGTNEGVSSRAMAARRTIIVDDYERYRHRVRRLDRYRFRAVLCAPLVGRDVPIGALNVHATDTSRRFDEEDAALLAAFAAHAAIAIDNARRFGNETRLALDLASANEELERSLSLQSRLSEQVLLDAGPAGVASELARLLERPVVVQDALLHVVAGSAPRGENWEALALSRDEWGDIDRVLGEIVSAGRPARIGDDGEARVVAPIRAGSQLSGFLVLSAPAPLSALDRALMDVAVTGVALELARIGAQVEVEQRLRGDVITDLVTGGFASRDSIAARAARLGLDLRIPHDVFVVRAIQTDGTGGAALRRHVFDLVRDVVESWSPGSTVAAVGSATVVLAARGDAPQSRFGSRDAAEIARDLHSALSEHLPTVPISIAIGERCHDPTAYAGSFELAIGALDAMTKLLRRDHVVDGRRLGVSRVLISAADPSELRAFAQRTLGPLLDDGRTELLETLRAYVDAGFNQREAARRSFVHFNTVAYRLRRVEELLGVEFRDPYARLDLTLALQIAALDGPPPNS
jgi:sugar diacid utilization regulator